jgi:hypothetical protein
MATAIGAGAACGSRLGHEGDVGHRAACSRAWHACAASRRRGDSRDPAASARTGTAVARRGAPWAPRWSPRSCTRHSSATPGAVRRGQRLSVYVSRGLEAGATSQPCSLLPATLAWSSSGGLVWTEALVLILAAAGARVRRSQAQDRVLAAVHLPVMRSGRWRSSPRSATRRRGTCCRSTRASS